MSRECTNWLTPYRIALLETDDQKLPSRIEVAMRAIHKRERELAKKPSCSIEEAHKLSDALLNLRTLFRLGAA
jgi:hypothetical protein